jgi:uncharacterized protein (TIGR00255 family)
MKSMTAFAQVLMTLRNRRFRLEIQSLNKKGLDIITDLPQTFLSLSIPIRLYLSTRLERGSVLIRLKEESSEKVPLNENDLNLLKERLCDLAEKTGYSSDVVSFEMLLDKASFLQSLDVDMNEMTPHLKLACDKLIEMREQEGERLHKDLSQRLDFVRTSLTHVESLEKQAPLKIKQNLIDRLKQLQLQGHDEDRLQKEVIYYVEKQDVTEELTRLKSHLSQMHHLFMAKEATGRKLEFLVQECFRELNTLSAKTSELEVINLTLGMKTEFEKIKEQVMNIE